MKRGLLGTILWTILAALIGVGLFTIKHEVKDQERRLNALNAEIQRNQENIHVLRAEWSYLNDPVRLRALAERHLSMHTVRPTEIATLDTVLRDGLPAPVMLAGKRPGATAVAKAQTAPKAQPAKLADSHAKAKPAEVKTALAKPKPPAAAVAKAEPPAPPRNTKTLVIRSPSLAQSVGEPR